MGSRPYLARYSSWQALHAAPVSATPFFSDARSPRAACGSLRASPIIFSILSSKSERLFHRLGLRLGLALVGAGTEEVLLVVREHGNQLGIAHRFFLVVGLLLLRHGGEAGEVIAHDRVAGLALLDLVLGLELRRLGGYGGGRQEKDGGDRGSVHVQFLPLVMSKCGRMGGSRRILAAIRAKMAAAPDRGADMDDVRIEKDTFGPIEVPAARLWGAQTQRSLEHFRISGERMPRELIEALALVKRACATVNAVTRGASRGQGPSHRRGRRRGARRDAGTRSFRWSCGRPARARRPT